MAHFSYSDRGTMATIGRNRAVAMIRGLQLDGFIAWIAWVIIHVYMLIGFRNRLVVMVQWAWAYATRQRGARMILELTQVDRVAVSRSADHSTIQRSGN